MLPLLDTITGFIAIMLVLRILVKSLTSLIKNHVDLYSRNLKHEVNRLALAVLGKSWHQAVNDLETNSATRQDAAWFSAINWQRLGDEFLTKDHMESVLTKLGAPPAALDHLGDRLQVHAANLSMPSTLASRTWPWWSAWRCVWDLTSTPSPSGGRFMRISNCGPPLPRLTPSPRCRARRGAKPPSRRDRPVHLKRSRAELTTRRCRLIHPKILPQASRQKRSRVEQRIRRVERTLRLRKHRVGLRQVRTKGNRQAEGECKWGARHKIIPGKTEAR